MKKALLFSVVVCLFIVAAQAQSCDPGDLSISGLSHYNKSMEYIEHLDLGTHEKAVGELEALIKTDSLWCDGVYKQLGYLCELIYNDSKNNIAKQRKFLKKAVHYYKVYLRFNENDRAVINNVSKLESLLDIGQTTINNSIKIEMVYVEGMLNKDTTDCIHSFYISKYEVTQAQWEAVMGTKPSYFKGPNLPVENILPENSSVKTGYALFINELNRITGAKYRIPTVIEWQYAAKGGINQENYAYSGSHSPYKVGWLPENSDNRTHPVGEKEPNILGIYDMTGNVAEITLCSEYGSGFRLCGGSALMMHGGSTIPLNGEESCRIDYTLNPFTSYNHLENRYYAAGYGNLNYYLISSGIRLLREIDYSNMSEEEKKWDALIYNKKMAQEKSRQKEEKAYEEMIKKIEYKNSFYPIIQSDGNWVDINIGYDFDSKVPIAYATISPGPIYASALVFDSASFFYSAGASLKIVNRFNLRLGLAYSAQNSLFGMDVGLGKQWKNFGVSGGALLFQNDEIIPHLEIECYRIKAGAIRYKKQLIPTLGAHFDMSKSKWKSKWEFNISSIYGYDFKDKHHIMGLTGFYAPFYVSGMYQTDKNYCVTIGGVSTIFDSECWGVHGALAYSSSDNFGIDIGLTYSGNEDGVALGNLSVGALIYKDKIIPTVGLGGAGGFGALGIAGIIAAVIWGSYELYMGVKNN